MSPMDYGKSFHCEQKGHQCKLIVLTGGPGAGKTAVLELARRTFGEHIAVLPEAASIIFRGGFIRKETHAAKKAAQRAIYHVQKELEMLTLEEHSTVVALCDRGTLDGLAYWPDEEVKFFEELRTSLSYEISRYYAVIHLKTPSATGGYNYNNPVRVETALEASVIDEKILKVWKDHSRRFVVESTDDFIEKSNNVINIIKAELSLCCDKPD